MLSFWMEIIQKCFHSREGEGIVLITITVCVYILPEMKGFHLFLKKKVGTNTYVVSPVWEEKWNINLIYKNTVYSEWEAIAIPSHQSDACNIQL